MYAIMYNDEAIGNIEFCPGDDISGRTEDRVLDRQGGLGEVDCDGGCWHFCGVDVEVVSEDCED